MTHEISMTSNTTISYRSDVHQPRNEANDTDDDNNRPSLPVREIVADDGHDTTGQWDSTSDAQRQQHQEEHDGEELVRDALQNKQKKKKQKSEKRVIHSSWHVNCLRKYLRDKFEFGDGIWVADERQAGSGRDDFGHISPRFVSQITQDRKDRYAGKETG